MTVMKSSTLSGSISCCILLFEQLVVSDSCSELFVVYTVSRLLLWSRWVCADVPELLLPMEKVFKECNQDRSRCILFTKCLRYALYKVSVHCPSLISMVIRLAVLVCPVTRA